jgi:hypothetical protein
VLGVRKSDIKQAGTYIKDVAEETNQRDFSSITNFY